MALTLKTPAFAPGGDIPAKFTCSGPDLSPALSWSDVPAGARSLTLIVDDPDAPAGVWTHWVVFDLPPQPGELPEGTPRSEDLPNRARQGRNDFRKLGYGGPCPPPGKPHRYFFKLYALDAKLNLKGGASRQDVERAMQGHILAQAELMGKFKR